MSNIYDDFTNLKRHIESCMNMDHIEMCNATMERFLIKWKKSPELCKELFMNLDRHISKTIHELHYDPFSRQTLYKDNAR